jgi:peptidoglycan/xylan/chitin deacetylase (PgdA/CDA1 family)
VAAVTLVLTAATVVAVRRDTPRSVVVRLNGRTVAVRGAVRAAPLRAALTARLGAHGPLAVARPAEPAPAPTVAAALAAARLPPRPGDIRSVATHRVVGHTPPRVLVDGGPALLSSTVRDGDRVEVGPGTDVLEAVVTRPLPPTPSGLPDVERHLWHAPPAPAQSVLVGELSGEMAPSARPRPTVTARPETDKVVALSFDDGPDPDWTPEVLSILRDEGVLATFCLVGRNVGRHQELAGAVAAAGHTICNHTADHDVTLDHAPHERVVDEIGRGGDLIRAATGSAPRMYRPPAGALSPDIISVAHDNGLRVLYWTVDPSDYLRPPASAIVERVLAHVEPGAVILLHDGGGDRSQTVAALRPLIDGLRAQGYRFSTPAKESAAT